MQTVNLSFDKQVTKGNVAVKQVASLAKFGNEEIDWSLSPEMAVTLYLEWGNNNWNATHPPVRSKSDVALYFVVDTWCDPIQVHLIRRNSEQAEELVSVPLPDELAQVFHKEYGELRGIFEPLPEIKQWLKKELGYY